MADKLKKGVWMHNVPKESPDEVKRHAERLVRGGFDLFIPCVKNPDSMLDYHTKIGVISPEYKEWDPLRVFCEALTGTPVKIHPWLCLALESKTGALIQRNPDLQAVDRAEPFPRLQSACMSQDEVHDYELSIYEEMMDNYPIAGVHLDYVRYQSGGCCFCNYCRTAFRKLTGIDPIRIQDGDEGWPEWIEWRKNNITRFVERVRQSTKKRGRELSAAVFAGYPECITGVGQDWADWERRGLLDFVFPMNYTMVPRIARQRAVNHIATVSGKTPLYEGLWYRPTLKPQKFLQQVEQIRELGIQGIVIFEYYRLTDEDLDTVREL